jgi:16S rRNA (adenine1518-N6/adenine1519-N6)-dimethyltransferase
LKEKFKEAVIINEDFLKVKPFDVDVIFGNLPYYISSKILFKLYEWNFSYAVLMFQKEFVEKMIAKPGTHQYSRLSVNAQNCYDIKKVFCVSPRSFKPMPKVDSCVVMIKKKPKELDDSDHLIQKLFSQKNKKIKNIFKELSYKIPEDIKNKRPWQLTIDDIKRLKELTKNNN